MQDALNEMQRLLTDISDEPETYVNKSPRSPDGGSRIGGRRAALVDAMSESMDVLKSSMDHEGDSTDNDAERDSDGLRYV